MNRAESQKTAKNLFYSFDASLIFLAVLSVCALTATFFVSIANLGFEIKTAVFLAVVVFYLACTVALFVRQKHSASRFIEERNKERELLSKAEIEGKLLALEEANQFFGASLKPVDMFRLVSSRIDEMIPFASCALFLAEDSLKLKAVGAVGDAARELMNLKSIPLKGAFEKAFASGEIQFIENVADEKNILSADVFRAFETAFLVPLTRNETEVFGILALFGNREDRLTKESADLLEAVSTRVAPLFLSSIAFERSLSNALTDAITNLPNERAFFLILENQIAESQRFRDERPLTVLSIDIKSFNELNRRFGHATGDRVLSYAADVIKDQLRQMDFLSRAMSDEFLAILPTASDDITRDIQTRIERAFLANPFEISVEERIYLKFNFGAASFGKDGETAHELLEKANLRKYQIKSGHNSKVLVFPREYVN